MLGKEKTAKLYENQGEKNLYDPSDIIDIALLGKDIEEGKSDVCVAIRSNFSANEEATLNNFLKSYENMEALPQNLQKDLNVAINTKDLTKDSGKNYKKNNRKLLVNLYPDYVSQRPFLRVESKIGSLLTVLIGLFVCAFTYFGMMKALKSEEIDEVVANLLRRKKKK